MTGSAAATAMTATGSATDRSALTVIMHITTVVITAATAVITAAE